MRTEEETTPMTDRETLREEALDGLLAALDAVAGMDGRGDRVALAAARRHIESAVVELGGWGPLASPVRGEGPPVMGNPQR